MNPRKSISQWLAKDVPAILSGDDCFAALQQFVEEQPIGCHVHLIPEYSADGKSGTAKLEWTVDGQPYSSSVDFVVERNQDGAESLNFAWPESLSGWMPCSSGSEFVFPQFDPVHFDESHSVVRPATPRSSFDQKPLSLSAATPNLPEQLRGLLAAADEDEDDETEDAEEDKPEKKARLIVDRKEKKVTATVSGVRVPNGTNEFIAILEVEYQLGTEMPSGPATSRKAAQSDYHVWKKKSRFLFHKNLGDGVWFGQAEVALPDHTRDGSLKATVRPVGDSDLKWLGEDAGTCNGIRFRVVKGGLGRESTALPVTANRSAKKYADSNGTLSFFAKAPAQNEAAMSRKAACSVQLSRLRDSGLEIDDLQQQYQKIAAEDQSECDRLTLLLHEKEACYAREVAAFLQEHEAFFRSLLQNKMCDFDPQSDRVSEAMLQISKCLLERKLPSPEDDENLPAFLRKVGRNGWLEQNRKDNTKVRRATTATGTSQDGHDIVATVEDRSADPVACARVERRLCEHLQLLQPEEQQYWCLRRIRRMKNPAIAEKLDCTPDRLQTIQLHAERKLFQMAGISLLTSMRLVTEKEKEIFEHSAIHGLTGDTLSQQVQLQEHNCERLLTRTARKVECAVGLLRVYGRGLISGSELDDIGEWLLEDAQQIPAGYSQERLNKLGTRIHAEIFVFRERELEKPLLFDYSLRFLLQHLLQRRPLERVARSLVHLRVRFAQNGPANLEAIPEFLEANWRKYESLVPSEYCRMDADDFAGWTQDLDRARDVVNAADTLSDQKVLTKLERQKLQPWLAGEKEFAQLGERLSDPASPLKKKLSEHKLPHERLHWIGRCLHAQFLLSRGLLQSPANILVEQTMLRDKPAAEVIVSRLYRDAAKADGAMPQDQVPEHLKTVWNDPANDSLVPQNYRCLNLNATALATDRSV